MAKLRGSKKHELNAIAETLRLVISSSNTKQDLIDGINTVIRTAEAWAANGKPKLSNDRKPLLHKTNVKRSCPDICRKCGAEYDDILGIGSCGKCFYGHDA